MGRDISFEAQISELDLGLFSHIPTQSSEGDRISWLLLQSAIRRLDPGYVYLEIGSHLGGSIQQHIVDPKCLAIYSIDKRPIEQPDDRGMHFRYEGNSTNRMFNNLRVIPNADLSKLTCFDSDASDVNVTSITLQPNFCFIDGEHTRTAALADFSFCLRICAPDAVICFHDDVVIYRAIKDAMSLLRSQKIRFTYLNLGGSTSAIALGDCPILKDSRILTYARSRSRLFFLRRFISVCERWTPSFLRDAARRIVRLLVR